MDLPVVPIHHYPQYLTQCCDMINSEWKRSTTARMRSLESSNDNLPTSLILLDKKQVIGHCRLISIPSLSNSCFIETVVIHKDLRGRGYGTYLMKKAEEYVKKRLHLDIIYLVTSDKEKFYAKLGYRVCGPVSIYGCFINKCQGTLLKNVQSTNVVTNVPFNSINKKTYMCKNIY